MSQPQVVIVGGGLAGLATAVALAERGLAVQLWEAKRRLGGRAGSFVDPATGELIDQCQHVAMGCCTNYLDFCQRTGIAELFERHKSLHFFGPDGQQCDFHPASWLPAPLHLLSALFGLRFLSWGEKQAIARAVLRLVRMPATDQADAPTIGRWLRSISQPPRAIERFWQVVLVSALGESLERASLAAARKVLLDGFLAHPQASHVLVPRVSLGELYDRQVADWLRARGVSIHLAAPIAEVTERAGQAAGVRDADGSHQPADFVVASVPWGKCREMLAPELASRIPCLEAAERFAAAPITSVHGWFDRPLTDLPHAVLVGRLAQWMFARDTSGKSGAYYYQVVISAAHELAGREKPSILDEVLGDLQSVFPEARDANLIRSRIVTEHEAVFSVRPGMDALRPPQETPVENLFLAGDWTATGWPATMEGAVRSGYLAAEGILRRIGRAERIVVPDLPRGWLVRMIAGR